MSEYKSLSNHSRPNIVLHWFLPIVTGLLLSLLLFKGGLEVGRSLGLKMPVLITEDSPSDFISAFIRAGGMLLLALIFTYVLHKNRTFQTYSLLLFTVLISAFASIVIYQSICGTGAVCSGNEGVIRLNLLFFATQFLATCALFYFLRRSTDSPSYGS